MDRVGPPEVRTVEDTDVTPLVDVMARAFLDDPCFTWVFDDPSRRLDDLRLLFEAASAVFVPHGLSVTTPERAGVALWSPPGHHRADEEVIEPYAKRMGERYDPASLARLLEFFALTDEHHPERPHFYLGVLAADPARRGQGIGTACMAAVLRQVDAERAPAYLESSNEKNVPLYERHGFAATGVAELPDGGPPVFFMWREPR